MIDSDDVLLLRLLSDRNSFALSPSERPHVGAPAPDRYVAIAVWSFPPGRSDGVTLIRDGLLPVLRETDPAPLAVLTTEPAHNTFPRLPVRTGENVAAVITSYPGERACRRHFAGLRAHPLVRDEVLPGIEREQTAPPRTLRLAPTGRSLLS
ncbi:NIPSNAP family protein [Streptomyces sp. NPDC086077]|uniref:NIPSNAP family protein n=1 Tax=Streptomyces sp. NPDC086077 TaxID=3154862 RepID=UPI00342553DB